MKTETISAEEFDRRFDAGKDVSAYLDFSKATRPNRKSQKVNVDFPGWMVNSLDREARHLGITRQALIKVWIGERLAANNPCAPISS